MVRKTVLAVALCAVVAMGAACSPGPSSSGSAGQASSSQSGQIGSSSASSSASAAAQHQDYAELPQWAYLRDYETDMWVAYGSPTVATGGGTMQSSYLGDESLYVAYDYLNLGDDASLTGESLFALCENRLIEVDAARYDATSVDVASSSRETVNGWDMDFFVGSLEGASGSVPFAIGIAHHGDDVTWCAVFDDSSDQSADVADLQDWVDKIAHTYRDYEG